MSEFSNLMNTVPPRVKVATALVVWETLLTYYDNSDVIKDESKRLIAPSWQWALGQELQVESYYKNFGLLIEDILDSTLCSDENLGSAVAQLANYILWEIYSEAYQTGLIEPSQLVAEFAEGDETLWLELDQALHEINIINIIPNAVWQAIANNYAGGPRDMSVNVQESEFKKEAAP